MVATPTLHAPGSRHLPFWGVTFLSGLAGQKMCSLFSDLRAILSPFLQEVVAAHHLRFTTILTTRCSESQVFSKTSVLLFNVCKSPKVVATPTLHAIVLKVTVSRYQKTENSNMWYSAHACRGRCLVMANDTDADVINLIERIDDIRGDFRFLTFELSQNCAGSLRTPASTKIQPSVPLRCRGTQRP